MRKLSLLLLCIAIALVTACKKEVTDNSATETMSTSTTATDTSATTSTMASDTSASATTGTTSTTSTSGSLSSDDATFVSKAAQGGMAEVTLGQMASSKGTSADVKNFGNRMVGDHSKANDELKQLAQTKGVTLPTDIDSESKAVAGKLSKATGKDFDKQYISDMVDDHEKDVKDFEKASKDAKDPDIKAWATKTLPTLQDHLKMAKETKAKLK